jgi:cysteine dioxygenase
MNLSELFNTIKNKKLKDCIDTMNLYNSSDYLEYIELHKLQIEKYKYNENNYCRIKLEEFSNNDIEFILILWKPNSETRIHDHPEKGCLMKVLNGSLTEIIYNNNKEKIKENKLNSLNSSYIEGDKYIHKIINNNVNSISLHIYSPPNHISKKY